MGEGQASPLALLLAIALLAEQESWYLEGIATRTEGLGVRQGSHHDRVVGEPLSYVLLALSLSLHIGQIAPVGATTTKNKLYPFYRFRASQIVSGRQGQMPARRPARTRQGPNSASVNLSGCLSGDYRRDASLPLFNYMACRWIGAVKPPCCRGRGLAERPRNQYMLLEAAVRLGPLCNFGTVRIGFDDSNCDAVDLLVGRAPGCRSAAEYVAPHTFVGAPATGSADFDTFAAKARAIGELPPKRPTCVWAGTLLNQERHRVAIAMQARPDLFAVLASSIRHPGTRAPLLAQAKDHACFVDVTGGRDGRG